MKKPKRKNTRRTIAGILYDEFQLRRTIEQQRKAENKCHEAQVRDSLISIDCGIKEIVAGVNHGSFRVADHIETAIYSAANLLKPRVPIPWWRRQWNRLQLWWWNRKLAAPVVQQQNAALAALREHENRIKDDPPCGRWS
jgi:hypothetical protein